MEPRIGKLVPLYKRRGVSLGAGFPAASLAASSKQHAACCSSLHCYYLGELGLEAESRRLEEALASMRKPESCLLLESMLSELSSSKYGSGYYQVKGGGFELQRPLVCLPLS